MASFIDLIPTWDDLYTQAKAAVKALRSGVSLKPGSKADIECRTQATLHHGAHMNILALVNNIIPTKASGIFLDAWLWLFGLPDGDRDSPSYGRIKARGSIASDALTVTATGATGDLNGEQFNDENGQTFQVNESYTFSGAGSADLDVLAVSTGTSTNLKSADNPTFEWVSTPANVADNPVLAADLENAANEETDSEGRARLADILQSPGLSASPSQWRRTIEETPGLVGSIDGYVLPLREAPGTGFSTCDYTALVRGESCTDRIPSTAQLADIETYVEAQMPVRMMRNSRILTPTGNSADINFEIEMSPDAPEDALCDADMQAIKTTVSANDAGGPEITANANVCAPTITGGFEVGYRVFISAQDGLASSGAEGIITAVNIGADAAKFEVSVWPTGWGTALNSLAGKYVQSGGGLISDINEAIIAYCDSSAPETDYDGTRYMASPVAADAEYRLKQIQAEIIRVSDYILDVQNLQISGAAADKSPTETDPTLGTGIYFLYPSQIQIWELK
jgi:hypothetical protein